MINIAMSGIFWTKVKSITQERCLLCVSTRESIRRDYVITVECTGKEGKREESVDDLLGVVKDDSCTWKC